MSLSLTWADATSELRSMPTTGHRIFMGTPSFGPTVQLPTREVLGWAFFTLRLAQLGELASSGNDCLLLRDHVEDAVLTVLNVEYELAQKGLVVFLTQHLVSLRKIITLLHL